MNDIKKACEILLSGGVVGIPTETVYGLAASIESQTGIDRIFSTKERPFFDPLIVHVSSINQAKEYTSNWNNLCEVLAKELWPGAVTLIVPKNDLISSKITSGLDTVGLRMPNHPMALELIEKLGHPVAAPSANKFKKTSPTSSEHVEIEFPEITVLDGGPCEIGIESTVLGIFDSEIKIYRPGMITKEHLLEILNDHKVTIEYVESPVAPGHLKHHYMPKLPVIVQIAESTFDQIPEHLLTNHIHWPLPALAHQAARELYSKFREFDLKEYSSILITVTPEQLQKEDFKGILNRLEKAATIFI